MFLACSFHLAALSAAQSASSSAPALSPDEDGSAWPALLSPEDYIAKGTVDTIGGDLPIYHVGASNDGRCIIWSPDIYGFDSGLTRQLADRLSSSLGGLAVLVPDYFRGDYRAPGSSSGWRQHLADMSDWEGRLLPDWRDRIRPYAEQELGCRVYGAHGERENLALYLGTI